MMETSTGKAEHLIQLSGCGSFQVLMVILVNVVNKIFTGFTMMIMAFGNYNPGWRCADHVVNQSLEESNNTTFSGDNNINDNNNNNNINNDTAASLWISTVKKYYNKTSQESFIIVDCNESLEDSIDFTYNKYKSDTTCEIYDTCQTIEFNPRASTIVTEWSLLCDERWVPSIIISIQMAGVLIGSFVSGQLGDTFGRKITLYSALALNGLFNIASVFAPNWQVFATLKFFIGLWLGFTFNLYYVLPAEYLTSQWRSRLTILPSWHVGGIIFAVTAMLCRDWRTLHAVAGVMTLISCLAALWVPESLRWLEVQQKNEKFEKVARKMMSMNGIKIDVELCDKKIMLTESENDSPKPSPKIYTILDIFRKGYRLNSLIIGILWLVPAMIYYTINFGVKAMYGDFYVNLIIVFAIDIPFAIFPLIALHKMGRRTVSVLFMSIATACLLTATGFELWASTDIKHTGAFVLALLGKLTTNAAFGAVIVLTGEIYPTVVRSIGNGYANFVCRVGGIAAPFLIPQDGESIYVCYGIMGLLCLVCCVLVMKLPETKGRELREYFVEGEES